MPIHIQPNLPYIFIDSLLKCLAAVQSIFSFQMSRIGPNEAMFRRIVGVAIAVAGCDVNLEEAEGCMDFAIVGFCFKGGPPSNFLLELERLVAVPNAFYLERQKQLD